MEDMNQNNDRDSEKPCSSKSITGFCSRKPQTNKNDSVVSPLVNLDLWNKLCYPPGESSDDLDRLLRRPQSPSVLSEWFIKKELPQESVGSTEGVVVDETVIDLEDNGPNASSETGYNSSTSTIEIPDLECLQDPDLRGNATVITGVKDGGRDLINTDTNDSQVIWKSTSKRILRSSSKKRQIIDLTVERDEIIDLD